jgi:sortase A
MDHDKLPRKAAKRAMGIAESVLLVMGAALMAAYTVPGIHATVMSRAALREFALAEQGGPPSSDASGTPAGAQPKVDFSLWSIKRIRAYRESLTHQFATPLAVLKIPKIGLEVPVFNGTDDLTLNRGVGRIIGTAQFGQGGNVGIGGHRDGFFRGLKDLAVGDRIELKTRARTETYRVDDIRIVKPRDVQVLTDRGVDSLTLVTCFPFYFIGDAPQRYIVRATASGAPINYKASAPPNPTIGKIEIRRGDHETIHSNPYPARGGAVSDLRGEHDGASAESDQRHVGRGHQGS